MQGGWSRASWCGGATVAKQDGWAPIHVAAQKGQVACIDALVRRGADVNRAEEEVQWCGICMCMSRRCAADHEQEGATPTHVAARKGHVDCIEALVRHGADVNMAGKVSVEHVHRSAEPRLSGDCMCGGCAVMASRMAKRRQSLQLSKATWPASRRWCGTARM